MSILGIERVVFGVEDMRACTRFFREWGLASAEERPSRVTFHVSDGGEVMLLPAADHSLPRAIEPGPTVREVVWGVSDVAAIDTIETALAAGCPDVATRRPGAELLQLTDPMGLAIAFTPSRRTPSPPGAGQAALPFPRIDAPGPFYERAEPQCIGHIVFTTPDIDRVEAFYTGMLGFRVSDRYRDRAVFLRCGAQGEHHNLFLLKSPDQGSHVHHLAFGVRDIHEVFGGGMAMARAGWPTFMGPGRHVISSCYFWYFKNPCGGAAEYYADSDWVTEKWQAREFPQEPRYFSEWMLTDGVVRYAGVQRDRVS